jgi:transcriptional regulator with XRE-family HTH domain
MGGRVLRALRVALALSQERLADLAGLHRNFIGLIERGQRNPTYLTLLAISSKLNVPASKLIAADEQHRNSRLTGIPFDFADVTF